MFDSQISNPLLKVVRVSDNDFFDIVPSVSNFNNLLELKVDRNRFHFDDLYEIVDQFQLTQVSAFNPVAGSAIPHFVPMGWITGTFTLTDTFNVFIYHPQDSAGIGGVRRRPHGDSMELFSTVGFPINHVNNLKWYRD